MICHRRLPALRLVSPAPTKERQSRSRNSSTTQTSRAVRTHGHHRYSPRHAAADDVAIPHRRDLRPRPHRRLPEHRDRRRRGRSTTRMARASQHSHRRGIRSSSTGRLLQPVLRRGQPLDADVQRRNLLAAVAEAVAPIARIRFLRRSRASNRPGCGRSRGAASGTTASAWSRWSSSCSSCS